MREPRFWSRDVDPKSREAAPLVRFLLTPLSWIYAEVTRRKIRNAEPARIRARVICVGNVTAGGVGKSPIVAVLRSMIQSDTDLRVATLSRGYKGKLKGPIAVDPEQHTARDVGDEPLMMSYSGETWIGADRAAAGNAMDAAGIDVIIMDDGHQNPGLYKDFSFIVVDAKTGFGNGYVIPKGPLRETVSEGLRRADAIIVVGDGDPPQIIYESDLPVFHAHIAPAMTLSPGRYVAFAGIGRPEKFFDTLKALNVDLRDAVPFPDHHNFSEADLRYLQRLASDHAAQLITTEKDFVRLSAAGRDGIAYLPITVQFDLPTELDKVINDVMNARRDG